MPVSAFFLKGNFSKAFTLSRVAEKNNGSLWVEKHIYTAKKEYLEIEN